jgi:hypothetical protein
MVAAPEAVQNAVADALGIAAGTQLPRTPNRVLHRWMRSCRDELGRGQPVSCYIV